MTGSVQWRSHDAPFGHCAGCGQDLPISTGGDGDVIMSLGRCDDCGLTTVWSPVNLVTESNQGPKPSAGAKSDELALWAALEAGEKPREAGPRLDIPPSRVEYLCLKWARQGIYDYGVVHDLGWIKR